MHNLVLEIDKKVDIVRALNLPYQKISIKEFSFNIEEKVFNIVKNHRKHVKSIKLGHGLFLNLLHMISANLTEISLRKYFTYNGDEQVTKMDFPHLTTLILLDSACFIDHIRSHKIETLKVAEIEYKDVLTDVPEFNRDRGDWGDFLWTCSTLKHLYLQNFVLAFDFSEFVFELTSLELVQYYIKDREKFSGHFFDAIFKLIKEQKNSLKKVSVGVELFMDAEILFFMLNEMKIEELNWLYDNRDAMNWNLMRRTPNLTLKKLHIQFTNEISENFLEILKTLRAVEDFYVDFAFRPNWNNFFCFVNRHMVSLKTFTMRIHEYQLPRGRDKRPPIEEIESKMLQVETLNIHGFPKYLQQRMNFLTCAPNIKKLIIKCGRQLSDFHELSTEEFKGMLEKLVNLEEFCGNMEIDDEVLAVVASHSKLRRIMFEYFDYQTSQIVSERLKAANPRLVVMTRPATIDGWDTNNEFEIFSLFEEPDVWP